MTAIAIIAGLVTTIWIGLVCAIRLLKPKHQPLAVWLAVFLGVPLLGLLTLIWGPAAGGAAFLFGAGLLFLRVVKLPRTG